MNHFDGQMEQELGDHGPAEVNLRQDLNLVTSILQTVRDVLMILDADLRVKMVNRSFYETFQVGQGVEQGKFIYELGNGEWDIPALRTLLEEILPESTHFDGFEVEHEFPHIGRKTMLLHARRVYQDSNLYQDSNQAPLILLVIQDITENKRLEKVLQAYNRKLEWSNNELQEFAYIASHDLQEPLRAIQAFGERLQEKHGEALNDEGRDYLNRIQNAASRMRTLIKDLLAYSRVTTKPNPFKPVDLEKVAKAVVSDLCGHVEESEGRVEVGALPTIEADASQMRQMLENLIGNALKFRRADVSPVIRVYTTDENESPLVSTVCAAEGEDGSGEVLQFVVEDNGIGFDHKYAERIFAPFERLHSHRQYDGTGIGLAICHKIVERHGGDITAQSTLGRITRFIVTLPVRQQQKETVL